MWVYTLLPSYAGLPVPVNVVVTCNDPLPEYTGLPASLTVANLKLPSDVPHPCVLPSKFQESAGVGVEVAVGLGSLVGVDCTGGLVGAG